MKKSGKILTLLLALTFLSSSFIACSNNAPDATDSSESIPSGSDAPTKIASEKETTAQEARRAEADNLPEKTSEDGISLLFE